MTPDRRPVALDAPGSVHCLGVTGYYGRRPVLRDVSVSVPAGQCLAVVGANGSGKTTFLRALLGQVRLDGEVWVDGYPVRRAGAASRRRLGYAPQQTAFWPNLTGAEVVAFVQRLRGQPADPGPVLERVGLGAAAGQRVRTYSGGMLRRLSLALATVGDPAVLLLDEPEAGLDAQGQGLILELIRGWKRAGATVILTVHGSDRAPLLRLADRLLVLREGRLARDLTLNGTVDRRITLEWLGPAAALGRLAARWRAARLPGEPARLADPTRLVVALPEQLLAQAMAALHPLEAGLRVRVREPGPDEWVRTAAADPEEGA